MKINATLEQVNDWIVALNIGRLAILRMKSVDDKYISNALDQYSEQLATLKAEIVRAYNEPQPRVFLPSDEDEDFPG